jgi:hypothetical protein
MSNQEHNDETKHEKTITYVYLPDDGIYGTIVQHGAYASMIEYHEDGLKYLTEVSNDEFIVVDEIGVGYIDETDDNL